MAPSQARNPVPVTIVGGALGAGKTTLINRLLGEQHGLRLAAIVNDFGSVNIDAELLGVGGREVLGLRNGCICCSLQGDLLRTLKTVLSHPSEPEGIVIEASGVADPRGIMNVLFDPVLRPVVRLDTVLTVVDAEEPAYDDPLWRVQIDAADILVVSKTGSDAGAVPEDLLDRLKGPGPAQIFASEGPEAFPAALLFNEIRGKRRPSRAGPLAAIDDSRFEHVEWLGTRPVRLADFQKMIELLAPALLRAKGFMAFQERPGERFLFQMVGRRASLEPCPGKGEMRLVLIGRLPTFDPERVRALLDRL